MGSRESRGVGEVRITLPASAQQPPSVRIALTDARLAVPLREFLTSVPVLRPLITEVVVLPDPRSNGMIPVLIFEAAPAHLEAPFAHLFASLPEESQRHPMMVEARQLLQDARAAGATHVRLSFPLPSALLKQEGALPSGVVKDDGLGSGKHTLDVPGSARGAGIRQPQTTADPQRASLHDPAVAMSPNRAEDAGARQQHAFYSEVRGTLVQALLTLREGEGVSLKPRADAPLIDGSTHQLGNPVSSKGTFDKLFSLFGNLDSAARELFDKRTMLRESAFQRVAYSAMLAGGLDGPTAMQRLQDAFGGKLAIAPELLNKLAQQASTQQQPQAQQLAAQQAAQGKVGRLPEEMLLQQQRHEAAKGKASKPSLGYRRIDRLLDDHQGDPNEAETGEHQLDDETSDEEDTAPTKL